MNEYLLQAKMDNATCNFHYPFIESKNLKLKNVPVTVVYIELWTLNETRKTVLSSVLCIPIQEVHGNLRPICNSYPWYNSVQCSI